MSKRQADLICLVLVALAFGLAARLYSHLPDPVPVHWNALGRANGYVHKPWGAFVLPFLTLVGYALLRIAPSISPKGFRVDEFIGVYNVLMVATVAILFGATFLILATANGAAVDRPRLISVGAGLLALVLGNYMGKLKRNFIAGIRTPWTLASDEVWMRTHRLAGKLLVAGGLVALLAGVLDLPISITAAALASALLVPVVYSLVISLRID